MALEFLAGPYPLRYVAKDTQPDGTPDRWERRPFWFDDLGLCGFLTLPSQYCLAQIDGTGYMRYDAYGGLADADLAYDEQTNGLILAGFGGLTFHVVDPYLGGIVDLDVGPSSSFGTRLLDRMLQLVAGKIQARPIDWSTSYANETTLTPTIGGSAACFYPAGNGLYYVCCDNGAIFLYNALTKAQVGHLKHLSRAVRHIHYSKQHNFFIVVEDDGAGNDQIMVYANEVIPETITTPVALTPLTKGQVSTIQVMVHGSGYLDYERAVGVLVNWQITAGPGSLSATQSTTDEDGYAEIDYIADTVSTGNVTIEASREGPP